MILIYSKYGDIAVDLVIDYLIYTQKEQVVRIGYDSNISIEKINISTQAVSIIFSTEYKSDIDIEDITSLWFHGGYIGFNLDASSEEMSVIRNILQEDHRVIVGFIIDHLIEKKSVRKLGVFKKYSYLKLSLLQLASNNGVDIPRTLVTSKKENLVDFLRENNDNIITKTLETPIGINSSNWLSLGHRTECVNKENIAKLGDVFFPTLVQEHVEKLFELRIFFIETKLFPMAIFSQSDEMTKMDFRNYNLAKPNRYVPYILPADIEKNILIFLNETTLTTGSIDMIVTKNKQYVFLEINPCGQFAFVSDSCNYHIEKYISEYLVAQYG